jgi:uncharacterized protein (DUF433 family)
MQLHTLPFQPPFRPGVLIENYESFIWTDRYAAAGDFSIVCENRKEIVEQLQVGTFIGFSESNRIMQVESFNRKEDDDGRELLTISGRSLEWLLAGRPATKTLSNATWDLTGTVGQIIVKMVGDICVAGTGIHVDDIIPYLITVDATENTFVIKYSIKAGNLYDAVREVASLDDVGIRISYNPNGSELQFWAYVGVDRTGPGGVTFGKSLENLSSTSYLRSVEDYKTGAYVYAQNGVRLVTAPNLLPGWGAGFKRNILMVDATDITLPAGPDLQTALLQRAYAELAEHNYVSLYDGEVNPNSAWKYYTDYYLGDLVDLKGDYGETQTMRVTEHIWSADVASGYTSYPTLSAVEGA